MLKATKYRNIVVEVKLLQLIMCTQNMCTSRMIDVTILQYTTVKSVLKEVSTIPAVYFLKLVPDVSPPQQSG